MIDNKTDLTPREKCILNVMEKTGKDRESVVKQLNATRKKFKITYADYNRYNFFDVPEDEQERELQIINEKREIRKETREQNLLLIAKKTGLSKEEAEAQYIECYKRINITTTDYVKYEFYNIPIDEQQSRIDEIKQERLKLKEERQLEKIRRNEEHILHIMQETGWTRDYTIEKVSECERLTGNDVEAYAINRFWELNLEEQSKYYSKGDADTLVKTYNISPKTLRTFMFKDLFCERFSDYLGRPWMSTTSMNYDDFIDKFSSINKLIYKPRSLRGGYGVKVFEYDENSIKDVFDEISKMPEGLVEGYITQHPVMQSLSLKSVNTIRIVTIRTDKEYKNVEPNKLHFCFAGIRMGRGDSVVDNLHGGGMTAGIDIETGEIITNATDYLNNVYEYHPDTGTKIKGLVIPYFKEVKEMLIKAAGDINGYYGWDIAITENGPIIIESNTQPGYGCLQSPYIPMKMGMRHVMAKFIDV